MNSLIHAAPAAVPLAGWGLHAVRMRRRVERARRDPLTGLHTREVFVRHAVRRMRAARCVVLVLDLDGFKQLNDACGHAAGDAALHATAQRLASWCGDRGLAARLGGDEFAAIVADPHSEALGQVGQLHAALSAPIACEGGAVSVGASLGVVETVLTTCPLSEALRRADEAMYVAKRSGGGWHLTCGTERHFATVNGRREGRDRGGAR